VLIHSNVGDLLHSLDSPGGPKIYDSPKLVALNREGNIVVTYEKGGICLFTVNGKLLCDILHSESVQVSIQVSGDVYLPGNVYQMSPGSKTSNLPHTCASFHNKSSKSSSL